MAISSAIAFRASSVSGRCLIGGDLELFGKRQLRSDRHDAIRVERFDRVIASLDVIDTDCRSDAWDIQHAIEISGEVRIIRDAPQIALEQPMISRVEADEGDEESDICFRQTAAEEKGAIGQKTFQPVKRGEDLVEGFFVSFLRRCKACALNAVVQAQIDDVVERIDAGTQIFRVKIICFVR